MNPGSQTMFWELPQDELEKIFSILRLRRGSRILDIGCGTGSLCDRLSKSSFNVVGIDKHLAAIITAGNNFGSAARFLHVPLENYKPDSKFDLSIFMLSLAFMDNQLQALRIAKKISRRLIIITPVRDAVQQLSQKQKIISVKRAEFIENLIRAGFTRIRTFKTFVVEDMPVEVFLLT